MYITAPYEIRPYAFLNTFRVQLRNEDLALGDKLQQTQHINTLC